MEIARPAALIRGSYAWRQKRNNLDVARRPCLAGQPDVWRGTDPSENPHFIFIGWGEFVETRADPDPACRASATSTANGCMRQTF